MSTELILHLPFTIEKVEEIREEKEEWDIR